MTETAPTAPAPTREVLGDLLVAVAELNNAVRGTELGQFQLINALMAALLPDGKDKALEELQQARASLEARWTALDENWATIQTMIERFAGAKDA